MDKAANPATHALIRDLATELLYTVEKLEEAQDVFVPNQYAKAMLAYDRAIEWMRAYNKGGQ